MVVFVVYKVESEFSKHIPFGQNIVFHGEYSRNAYIWCKASMYTWVHTRILCSITSFFTVCKALLVGVVISKK